VPVAALTTVPPMTLVATIVIVVPIPLVAAIAMAMFPAIDIEELSPGDSVVALQRGMPVPLSKRLIAFQPAWHVLGPARVVVIVRRLV